MPMTNQPNDSPPPVPKTNKTIVLMPGRGGVTMVMSTQQARILSRAINQTWPYLSGRISKMADESESLLRLMKKALLA